MVPKLKVGGSWSETFYYQGEGACPPPRHSTSLGVMWQAIYRTEMETKTP